jgi:hypothetical protein
MFPTARIPGLPEVLLECYFEKVRSTGFRLGAPSSSRIAAFTNSVFFVG